MRNLLFAASALLLVGCSQNPAPPSVSPPQTPASTVNLADAGSISGVISFKGATPKMPMLDLSADPACPADPQPQDVVVIQNGKLANVFVYIRDGLNQTIVPVPSQPVVLDQKNCRYVPHVLGLMVGQQLKVLNDDNAEHNIHPMSRSNDQWNESQMPRGKPIVKTFQHPELNIPVRCDQHPWMEMYLNVLTHPYFAVSADDGTFQIKDVPPGDYTLVATHEKFGEQTMKITVPRKQPASANFVFTPEKK